MKNHKSGINQAACSGFVVGGCHTQSWATKVWFHCRSIRNKGPILCDEVKTGNFDVFGLTETHIKALDTPSFLNELTPEEFSLVHTSRVSKCGGSVGFFIKTALDFKTIYSPEFSIKNHIVSITLEGRRLFLVSWCRLPSPALVALVEILKIFFKKYFEPCTNLP